MPAKAGKTSESILQKFIYLSWYEPGHTAELFP